MLQDFIKPLSQIADKTHENHLKRLILIIDKIIKENNKIFICRNGGSASLSVHTYMIGPQDFIQKSDVKYLPYIKQIIN